MAFKFIRICVAIDQTRILFNFTILLNVDFLRMSNAYALCEDERFGNLNVALLYKFVNLHIFECYGVCINLTNVMYLYLCNV